MDIVENILKEKLSSINSFEKEINSLIQLF